MTTRDKWGGFQTREEVALLPAQPTDTFQQLKAEGPRLVEFGIRAGLILPPGEPKRLAPNERYERRLEYRRRWAAAKRARERQTLSISRGTSQTVAIALPAKPTTPPQTPHRAAGSALNHP